MRIAITGRGLVSPLAIGLSPNFERLRRGEAGIVSVDTAPAGAIACVGRVPGFDPKHHVPGPMRVQTDRWTHLGLAVAAEALEEAGLEASRWVSLDRVGVVAAAGSGGNEFGQRELQKLYARGPASVGPYQSIAWFSAALTGQVSIRFGFRGPCSVVAAQEPGGVEAIASAAYCMLSGEADQVVACAAEAQLNPYAMACLQAGPGWSSVRDAAAAFQPFTADASGSVPAEGAAALVLEREEFAMARGAQPLAFVAGFGASFSLPGDRSRDGIVDCVDRALNMAGISRSDVEMVFPNAAAEEIADRAESEAIAEMFGVGVPVLLCKYSWGNLCSASALADAVVAVEIMKRGCEVALPASAVSFLPGVDVVTKPRPLLRPRNVLILASGADGTHAALVLTAN